MRISTIKRNNSIHLMYKNIMNDLGQLRTVVSKSYIYNLIQNQTGLSIRYIPCLESHKRTGYRFFVKSVHFHTFVYSLVFRFKFFHGISLEIRARSDAGPGLIYSALPKMEKA